MPVYQLIKISGLKDSSRRTIIFLEGGGCEARTAFCGLSNKSDRDIRARFDHWVDGAINDNYFHGWPNRADYKECFSFRWREQKVRCRLYGFLCHPRKSDPRFQACVLTGYDRKTSEDTDFAILDAAKRLKNDPHVKKLLESGFN